MVDSGDEKLRDHLLNSSARATYISKTTQNPLINCIGKEITDAILAQVGVTKPLTFLTSLNFPYYIDKNGDVVEDFVGFIDAFADVFDNENETTEDVTYQSDDGEWVKESRTKSATEIKLTGTVIGRIVTRMLRKLELNLDRCIGIGTDGCSVMQSELKGAVSEIQQHRKNVLRSPCFSHKLNLSLSRSNQVTCVRNAVGTMKSCVNFFDDSSKENSVLKRILGHQMQGLCESRWVERHDGVLQFTVDLPKVLQCSDDISEWEDYTTSSKASQLHTALTNSPFLASVVCVGDILALTLPLSKLLQKVSLSLDSAAEEVSNLITVLTKCRKESETYCRPLWTKIVNFASSVDVEMSIPRRYGRQGHRANYSTESCESYYSFSVFNQLLDYVIVDLKERFSPGALEVFNLPCILPCNVKSSAADFTILKQRAKELVTAFSSILPCEPEMALPLLEGELVLWQKKWLQADSEKLPVSSLYVLKQCDKEVYQLIYCLLSLLTTLPVSNASAERSFSALRRLKTWLRSTMSQERLTGIALMHIHRHTDINIDNVITRFANSKPNRRIKLTL